jgi:hypothetical protein
MVVKSAVSLTLSTIQESQTQAALGRGQLTLLFSNAAALSTPRRGGTSLSGQGVL